MLTGKFIFVFIVLFYLLIPKIFSQVSLTGTVRDADNQQPLPGATIYFPDIKSGGSTDGEGKYMINNLPGKKLMIQVTFIGYASIIETVDLSAIGQKDFELKESITEINEVVITGLSQSAEANRTATPITVVTKTSLLQNSSSNIIDALANQPGISEIGTGPAISKPEIRGLGYNRVVIVNDGIKQEGQQWGDEHGIEIDEFSVNRIEILKGPASLAYGSDAMAGVIHFITAPTLPDKTIKANLLSNYQTNNGLIGYSANIAGNINGFIWDARYSGKNAHAYQNKYDGYVYGSGFKENAANAIIGLNKKWGYTRLHAGYYQLHVGLVEGERDSATGKFIQHIAINDTTEGIAIASNEELKSYSPGIPYQEITHIKSVLENRIIIGNGALNFTLGWQQNNRKEFGDVLDPGDFELYFKMNTLNYDIKYLFPDNSKWQTAIGINGMGQTSSNLGKEVLIPEYDLFDIGIFATTKRNLGKLDISGGIRYDFRTLKSREYISNSNENIFNAFNRNFSSASGSIGATYQVNDHFYSKLNVARGFRSPNMAELGSNGVHEGTFRYELGNSDLIPETSLQTDASLGYDGDHISFEANIFNNSIANFIYLTKINGENGKDSIIETGGEVFDVFSYAQGNANLFGGEFIVDIHPHPFHWLHFENSFSFVNAMRKNATDSTKYLPFSPSPKLISEIKGDFKKVNKTFSNAYLKVQLENYFAQGHIYSAYNTETPTPGYTLINFGAGTDILSGKKTLLSMYLSINNIADVAYQSHLSRLKYAGENFVTGRSGVYGMGRNYSLKINIPVDI
ncbi:MAG: TonB-dependent receptor domain-containing protein [Chitinophagales bacterium]